VGPLVALTALLAAAPTFRPAPGRIGPDGGLASSASALRIAVGPSAVPVLPMPGDRPGASGPACLGDVCQPVVSVPGFEPRWRKSRNELALGLLERADIQPISALAARIARSGIQLDFAPAALDPSGARHGWGRLVVGYRWQLGAPRER
jgi:hypothetical protein